MILSRREALAAITGSAWAITAGCSRAPSPATDRRSSVPLHYQTLGDVAKRLQSRDLSSVDLTESILARISAIDDRLQS
jgi:hypothetical protein